MFAVIDTIYFTFAAERFVVRNVYEKIDRPHFRTTWRGLVADLQVPTSRLLCKICGVRKTKAGRTEGSSRFSAPSVLRLPILSAPWRRQADANANPDFSVQWLGTEERAQLLPYADCSECKAKELLGALICLLVKHKNHSLWDASWWCSLAYLRFAAVSAARAKGASDSPEQGECSLNLPN